MKYFLGDIQFIQDLRDIPHIPHNTTYATYCCTHYIDKVLGTPSVRLVIESLFPHQTPGIRIEIIYTFIYFLHHRSSVACLVSFPVMKSLSFAVHLFFTVIGGLLPSPSSTTYPSCHFFPLTRFLVIHLSFR